MVKKRFADGSTCRKCEQAEASLRRRGQWERIDEVTWADEADPASAGMRLATEHGVDLAPFFVVEEGDEAPRVYTTVVELRREVLEPRSGKPSGNPSGNPSRNPGPGSNPGAGAADLGTLRAEASGLDAPEVVAWALERFGPETTLAFSGAEDVVLIDLAVRTGRPFSTFVLDTGRLHPETYEFVERVREHYGIAIDVVSPDTAAVERLVREKGLFSFYRDGHGECCGIRKVEPLGRALAGRPAWLTGQRRDQSPTRAEVPIVEQDPRSRPGAPLFKVNPLAAWTLDDVWTWIRVQDLPYNPLHDRGFVSIGCAPCTRPPRPGEHPRAGRWWWEEATLRECGLHVTKPGEGHPP